MVTIQQDSQQTIYLTLIDRVTIAVPFYLMVLESHTNAPQVKFLMTDTSEYPDRALKFVITEGAAGDFTTEPGDYTYTVLQKSTASTTITGDEVELENGILRVTEDALSEVGYTEENDSISYDEQG